MIGLVLAAAIAASDMARVQEAVSHDFRDPGSAQFRNVTFKPTQDGHAAYCGEVNGKNAYGAYVGFVAFYYNPSIGRVWRADGDGADPTVVKMMCGTE